MAETLFHATYAIVGIVAAWPRGRISQRTSTPGRVTGFSPSLVGQSVFARSTRSARTGPMGRKSRWNANSGRGAPNHRHARIARSFCTVGSEFLSQTLLRRREHATFPTGSWVFLLTTTAPANSGVFDLVSVSRKRRGLVRNLLNLRSEPASNSSLSEHTHESQPHSPGYRPLHRLDVARALDRERDALSALARRTGPCHHRPGTSRSGTRGRAATRAEPRTRASAPRAGTGSRRGARRPALQPGARDGCPGRARSPGDRARGGSQVVRSPVVQRLRRRLRPA